jgi:hypothetical protein
LIASLATRFDKDPRLQILDGFVTGAISNTDSDIAAFGLLVLQKISPPQSQFAPTSFEFDSI